MAFDYVDDLQNVANVAKKDHVGLVRMATEAGTQLGAWPPHHNWRSSKLRAFLTKLVDEASRCFAATALLSDITINLCKVAAGCR